MHTLVRSLLLGMAVGFALTAAIRLIARGRYGDPVPPTALALAALLAFYVLA